MIAKVITKDNREYYSYVFAILNQGFDTAVITYDSHLDKFQHVKMYKKYPSIIRKVFVIDTDIECFTKIDHLKTGILSKHKPVLGFDWILEKDVLNNILANKDIDQKYKALAIDLNSKIEEQEWRYVKKKGCRRSFNSSLGIS